MLQALKPLKSFFCPVDLLACSMYCMCGVHKQSHICTQRTQLTWLQRADIWGLIYIVFKNPVSSLLNTTSCLTLAWARLAKRNEMWHFSLRCSQPREDSQVNSVVSAVRVTVWSAVDQGEGSRDKFNEGRRLLTEEEIVGAKPPR